MQQTLPVIRLLAGLTALSVLSLSSLLAMPTKAHAATYFVAPNGNDSTGDGTIQKPFRTIQRTEWSSTPGTTINLRGGTYTLTRQEWVGDQSGTAGKPITIQSYGSEWAVLDGSGLTTTDALVVNASYITIQNLEVRNSSGYGIALYGSNEVVNNCSVDNSYKSGIWHTGSNTQISNCRIWLNCKINSARTMNGGWPSALDGYQSSYASVWGNTVYDNWGEGIGFQASSGCYIGYNDVRDSYNANIYLNSSTGCLIEHNTAHCNWDGAFLRNDGNPASGIELGNEWGPSYPDFKLNWDTISANTVTDAAYGLQLWAGGDGGGIMQNTEIKGNTFQKATQGVVLIEDGDHTGSSLHDNTFGFQWNQTVSINSTGLAVYSNTSAYN